MMQFYICNCLLPELDLCRLVENFKKKKKEEKREDILCQSSAVPEPQTVSQ